MSCDCGTFTLAGDSYTVTLNKPEIGGEDKNLDNDIKLFDFWSGNFDTNFEGINSRPLTLSGVETLCGTNLGVCFPICFPMCFAQPMWDKFEQINEMMDNHEEVTITGLGNCIDGVYIISNFSLNTIIGTNQAIKWNINLELVRRL